MSGCDLTVPTCVSDSMIRLKVNIFSFYESRVDRVKLYNWFTEFGSLFFNKINFFPISCSCISPSLGHCIGCLSK